LFLGGRGPHEMGRGAGCTPYIPLTSIHNKKKISKKKIKKKKISVFLFY